MTEGLYTDDPRQFAKAARDLRVEPHQLHGLVKQLATALGGMRSANDDVSEAILTGGWVPLGGGDLPGPYTGAIRTTARNAMQVRITEGFTLPTDGLEEFAWIELWLAFWNTAGGLWHAYNIGSHPAGRRAEFRL